MTKDAQEKADRLALEFVQELHRLHPQETEPDPEWKPKTISMAVRTALNAVGMSGEQNETPETENGGEIASGPITKAALERARLAVGATTRTTAVMALTPLLDDALAGPGHWERRRRLAVNAVLEAISNAQMALNSMEYMTKEIAKNGRAQEAREIAAFQRKCLQSCIDWTAPLIAARDGILTGA